jgi:hypothetical protein
MPPRPRGRWPCTWAAGASRCATWSPWCTSTTRSSGSCCARPRRSSASSTPAGSPSRARPRGSSAPPPWPPQAAAPPPGRRCLLSGGSSTWPHGGRCTYIHTCMPIRIRPQPALRRIPIDSHGKWGLTILLYIFSLLLVSLTFPFCPLAPFACVD